MAADPAHFTGRRRWLRPISIGLVLALAAAALVSTRPRPGADDGGKVTQPGDVAPLLGGPDLARELPGLRASLLAARQRRALRALHRRAGVSRLRLHAPDGPELAPPGWRPQYVDYLILGLTTSTAFSPTDVLPMARWAKLTMALQSLISLVGRRPGDRPGGQRLLVREAPGRAARDDPARGRGASRPRGARTSRRRWRGQQAADIQQGDGRADPVVGGVDAGGAAHPGRHRHLHPVGGCGRRWKRQARGSSTGAGSAPSSSPPSPPGWRRNRSRIRGPADPVRNAAVRVAEALKASSLNSAAGVHADAAGESNQRSNNYVLAVVLFATALFFAGISTKVRALRQREVLLAVGWLIFLGTAAWVATFPVTFSV